MYLCLSMAKESHPHPQQRNQFSTDSKSAYVLHDAYVFHVERKGGGERQDGLKERWTDAMRSELLCVTDGKTDTNKKVEVEGRYGKQSSRKEEEFRKGSEDAEGSV